MLICRYFLLPSLTKDDPMSDLDHRLLDDKLAKKTNRFNTEELLRIENDKRYRECLDLADSDEDEAECAEQYPRRCQPSQSRT